MERLDHKILDWAEEKGIFEKATPQTQHSKLVEEVEELRVAMTAEDMPDASAAEVCDAEKHNIEFEVMDIAEEIGDCAVVLTILAHMHGLCIHDCLGFAYDKIRKRTGKMVDGVFVKCEPNGKGED